ncbi:GNAT family N-acetyltransferase [Halovenus rubra]|uniref:GNAT family N-acetyltransferase n=2 Tax=Halovenus rubra TaxID=869890 RepID=A0ACC7E3V4_9EURY|nr:GNAT family protein [Halovenus rubra]
MPGPVFIEGDQISLHPLEREDLPFIQTYRNHPDVRQQLGRIQPQNGADLEADFEGYMQNGVNLLVCTDNKPVGFVALFNWKESAGRVEIAYWIAPDEQGNGYATDAVSQAIAYAFDDRRCHKVVAGAHATNEASRGLLETLSFQQEGRLRDHIYLDGEWVDAIRYGLLEAEWQDERQA